MIRVYSLEKYREMITSRNVNLVLNVLLESYGSPIKPDNIAKTTGLSMLEVVEAIDVLKELGLYVDYSPNLGYTLPLNDNLNLIPKMLFGIGDVILLKEVESTMDIAWELVMKGAPSWTIVIAETQTKGRGRAGRAWLSPKGGLWFSVIIRLKHSIEYIKTLGLACSASVAESIRILTGLDAWVKWPNDIMLNKSKLGGVLIESEHVGDRCNIVVGCGINVNNQPPKVDRETTSIIAHTKKITSRPQLLRMIILRMKGLLLMLKTIGPKTIVDYWKQYSRIIGNRVRVVQAEGSFEGIAIDINDECSLIVRRDDNSIVKIYDADIELL